MTVKELRDALENVSEEVIVCCCGEYDNPYNDYWEAEKIIRVLDASHGEFDRICLMEKG